jgi:hypothetical protein
MKTKKKDSEKLVLNDCARSFVVFEDFVVICHNKGLFIQFIRLGLVMVEWGRRRGRCG